MVYVKEIINVLRIKIRALLYQVSDTLFTFNINILNNDNISLLFECWFNSSSWFIEDDIIGLIESLYIIIIRLLWRKFQFIVVLETVKQFTEQNFLDRVRRHQLRGYHCIFSWNNVIWERILFRIIHSI